MPSGYLAFPETAEQHVKSIRRTLPDLRFRIKFRAHARRKTAPIKRALETPQHLDHLTRLAVELARNLAQRSVRGG